MNINEKLTIIQTTIKAPKNLYNSFGKYKYRNAEGICEAVKPYLRDNNCALILTDEIIEIGGRVYVKAIARLFDNEGSIEVSAMARESETKKGQDDSQITGTASSYARKYALNGLFLLDDTKDADTDEYAKQTSNTKPQSNTASTPSSNPKEVEIIKSHMERTGVTEQAFFTLMNIKSFDEMTTDIFKIALAKFSKTPDKK